MSERSVPIEVIVATDEGECPSVEPASRIDVSVNGEMYPTVQIEDGRYVAWWFDVDAPPPDDPVTSRWVAAPTRFLAAATLRELWENPASFHSLVSENGESSQV